MKWFYNMKIGMKMISGFFIVIIFAGVIGVKGIIDINHVNKLDTKLYKRIAVPLGDIVNLTSSYQNIRANIRDVILAKNKSVINDEKDEIISSNSEFDKNMKLILETMITQKGKKVGNKIKDDKDKYMELVNTIIDLKTADKDDEALATLTSQNAKALVSDLESNLNALAKMKVDLGQDTSNSNNKTAKSTTLVTLIMLIIGIIAASGIAIFLSGIISKPVRKIMSAANKIAEGDLNVTLNIYGEDEIGMLAAATQKMSDRLNEVMSSIDAAAQQVASGASQVSASSINISEGATEQASSVQELTASIEEISAQITTNAENANVANTLAESARENALEGNSNMIEMQKSMEEINYASNNISKIIKAIDEIAFQTNILALNAAVEAARAGSNGKGFAVVAEEVRNLAARSSKAAKETAELIEGSIIKVEEGTKIADKTAESLNKITSDITQVATIISEISAASSEQSAGITQISQGIVQVSEVVQNNSAVSQESAAASEELDSQARILEDQISKFKFKRV